MSGGAFSIVGFLNDLERQYIERPLSLDELEEARSLLTQVRDAIIDVEGELGGPPETATKHEAANLVAYCEQAAPILDAIERARSYGSELQRQTADLDRLSGVSEELEQRHAVMQSSFEAVSDSIDGALSRIERRTESCNLRLTLINSKAQTDLTKQLAVLTWVLVGLTVATLVLGSLTLAHGWKPAPTVIECSGKVVRSLQIDCQSQG